jgi:hypothetical protein
MCITIVVKLILRKNREMKKINNPKSYLKRFVQTAFIIVSCYFLTIILKPEIFLYSTIFCFFLLLIISFQKVTVSIQVNETDLILTYCQFFKSKTITYPVSNLNVKLVRTASFRGGQYFILKVWSNAQKERIVDTRDGFSKKELEELINDIENYKSILAY